jgi:hypothetical protein
MTVIAISATASAEEGPLAPRAPEPPKAPRSSTQKGLTITGGVLVGISVAGTIGGLITLAAAPYHSQTSYLPSFDAAGYVAGGLIAIGASLILAIPGSIMLSFGLRDDPRKNAPATQRAPAIAIGPQGASLTWRF